MESALFIGRTPVIRPDAVVIANHFPYDIPGLSSLPTQDMNSPWVLPVLFVTGLCAGFVDSIAGGGGLITLPVLLNAGLSPEFALGTNKLQAAFGSGSATWHFAKAGLVDSKEYKIGVFFTVIGSFLGTLLVQQIDPAVLRRLIPFLLLGIALWSLLQPRLGVEDVRSRMDLKVFHLI